MKRFEIYNENYDVVTTQDKEKKEDVILIKGSKIISERELSEKEIWLEKHNEIKWEH